MNLIIYKRNPLSHIMLERVKNILEENDEVVCLQSSFDKSFLFKKNDSKTLKRVLVGDPLSFFMLFLFRRDLLSKAVLLSFEMYEYQCPNNSPYNILRNFTFRLLHYLSLFKANVVIFSNQLRKDFYMKKLPLKERTGLYFLENFYFSKLQKRNDIELEVIDTSKKISVEEIRQRYKKVFLYAGSIQSGRELDSLISSFSDFENCCLVCCGPKKTEMTFLNNTFYLGNLNKRELEKVYEISDFGFLIYGNELINTRLCAPVKLYEYLHYGLKPIANKNFSMMQKKEFIYNYFDSTEELGELIESSNPQDHFEVKPSEISLKPRLLNLLSEVDEELTRHKF